MAAAKPIFQRLDCRAAAKEAAVLGLQLILQAMELEAGAEVPAEVSRSVWLSAAGRFHEAQSFCHYAFDHAAAWEVEAWDEE